MVRTFTPYVPTVLKFTPEHVAKVPEGLKIHFNHNRVPKKNGSNYVTERAYYIDPKTHRPRAIASVKIGVIPPGETEMVPSASRSTAKKPAAMGNLAQKLDNVLCDERQLSKVRFPLSTFLTICLLCALTGRTDTASIADYWNAHAKGMLKDLDDAQFHTISADTVLRLMSLLKPQEVLGMAELLASDLVEPTTEDGVALPRVISAGEHLAEIGSQNRNRRAVQP